MLHRYISKDDVVTYLYKPYKRITPRISLDNVNYTNLSLLPLLTTDFITFGKQFDGELDLYESNLFLSDRFIISKIGFNEND